MQDYDRLDDWGEGMRVCVLGHALKGTLSAPLARKALELGVRLSGAEVFSSHCISDGGDGFLDAFREVRPGRIDRMITSDALGNLVLGEFFIDNEGDVAAVEIARVVGLAMIDPRRRDIMASGTKGVGTLIIRAIELGASEIHIGLGGSATCDGGLGMLVELSRALLGTTVTVDHPAARDLAEFPAIPLVELRAALTEIRLVVYCDVKNPLLGELGTARVFAPQKGAAPEHVIQLEAWLARWAEHLESQASEKWRDLPGAGAAGGLGFALAALGAQLTDGATRFGELLNLTQDLQACDALVTCEGRFDESSFHGKAPWNVASLAAENGCVGLIACGLADDAARTAAAEAGVTVLDFANLLPEERRNAEAFTLLQQAVSYFFRTGRTDAPPPMASGDRIQKL